MPVTVRSFAKINLGLCIGSSRPDGFHELRTVYQTIALHDILRLRIERGSGIEIRCADPRVPTDQTNTCYRMLERAMSALGARVRVVLEIEKRLPVQGGLGGASGNAVSALLALEIALKKRLSSDLSDRIKEFSRQASAWLSSVPGHSRGRLSGVPARGRGRAEILLLDLVRTGIENDFEQVVFPQYPVLRDVKCALETSGATYASLSGSGSAVYGIFGTKAAAERAATKLRKQGVPAQATVTLTRAQYWKRVQVSSLSFRGEGETSSCNSKLET